MFIAHVPCWPDPLTESHELEDVFNKAVSWLLKNPSNHTVTICQVLYSEKGIWQYERYRLVVELTSIGEGFCEKWFTAQTAVQRHENRYGKE